MNFDVTKLNIGSTDRLIRAVVGVLLVIGALRGGSWIAGLIGAAVLATAWFRFCPAYAAFNFSSDKDAVPAPK